MYKVVFALAGLTIDPERMRANMTEVLRGEDVGAADAFIDRALALYDDSEPE